MKILLTDTYSILEYLYRKEYGEEVSLTMDVSESTAIVGCGFNKNFYDKTLILTGIKGQSSADIFKLSKVNEVISRVPLPQELGISYKLDPYQKVKLKDLIIHNIRNKPISELSIKDFVVTRYKDKYYMDKASSYLGTKLKGNLTLVGLLKYQIQDENTP